MMHALHQVPLYSKSQAETAKCCYCCCGSLPACHKILWLFLLSLISPADVSTCSVLHMTGMVLVWPAQSLTCALPKCRGARVPQMRLCRAAAASHEAHTRDRHRHCHLPSAGRQRHWPVQQNCSLLLAGQCCLKSVESLHMHCTIALHTSLYISLQCCAWWKL